MPYSRTSVAAWLPTATVASGSDVVQQAQIGPETFVALIAIGGVGWAVHQIKSAASGSLADEAEYDACESCGSIVPEGTDRCESCATVGHWRK